MRRKPFKPSNSASAILVRRKPGHPCRALVTCFGRTEEAAIGRSGMTSRKREGDGATPIAAMRLVGGYVRGDRITPPPSALPLRVTPKDLLWCDAPGNASYNRPVRGPFRPSHEKMRREDDLYDICLVMDWNFRSRRRNGGSAIFFHLAKPGYAPTEGCIAVSLPAMQRLLKAMRRGTWVRVTG
ncbi:L,D-transpeptidase family protein [Pararhizobium gei]|uniref:L,D-transpeptidase family protein n=1 Tax=Pararhizobium gei TaxID=1395951 RepID=UPI0023DC4333|nr:L,D-transpeptidase family protein [Rhizobium gei]